jgi:hypothetical protein
MLERSERVNSGMYIQLHNAARAMSALGHHQSLSIQPGERLESARSSHPVDLANDAPCVEHSRSTRLEFDVCGQPETMP